MFNCCYLGLLYFDGALYTTYIEYSNGVFFANGGVSRKCLIEWVITQRF